MYVLLTLIPKLAHVFSGSSSVTKIKLLLQLWYFALTRKTFLRGRDMRFRLTYFGKPFNIYIESIVDLAALKEVFILEEYKWDVIDNPKVIIDLGAHFGDTTLYYHLKYPQAHIYAVEPAPETYKRLLKNVSGISNITPVQAGVAGEDGIADLNIVASSLGNSFKVRADIKNTVSVPVYTLRSLLQTHDIKCADLIKFDIEGAEESFFLTNDPEDFSSAYIGEVHGDLISIDSTQFLEKFTHYKVEKISLSNPKRFILRAVNIK